MQFFLINENKYNIIIKKLTTNINYNNNNNTNVIDEPKKKDNIFS